MRSAALRFLPAPERPGMRDRKSENPNRAPCAARKIPKAANQTTVKSSSRGQCRQQVPGKNGGWQPCFCRPGTGKSRANKKDGAHISVRPAGLTSSESYPHTCDSLFFGPITHFHELPLPVVLWIITVRSKTAECECRYRFLFLLLSVIYSTNLSFHLETSAGANSETRLKLMVGFHYFQVERDFQ